MLLSKPLAANELLIPDDSDNPLSYAYWERIQRALPNVVPVTSPSEGDDRAEDAYDEALARILPLDILVAKRVQWLAKHAAQMNSESANDYAWTVDDGDAEDAWHFDSLQEALAEVVEDVLSTLETPEVKVDGDLIRIFNDGILAWALRRVVLSPTINDSDDARFTGILTGLGQHANPELELANRLAALPGWGDSRLSTSQESPYRHGPIHFQTPKDWRSETKAALMDLGVHEPNSKQIEDTLSVMMRAASWNQLSANFKRAREDHRGLVHVRTYLQTKDQLELHVRQHGSVQEGLRRIVLAAQAMPNLADDWISPQFSLRTAEGQFTHMEIAAPLLEAAWRLEEVPSGVRSLTPSLQDFVRKQFTGEPLSEASIAKLMLTDLPFNLRAKRADEILGHRIVAEARNRRIYEATFGERRYLHVYWIDRDGVRQPGPAHWISGYETLVSDEATGCVALLRDSKSKVELVFTAEDADLVAAVRAFLVAKAPQGAMEDPPAALTPGELKARQKAIQATLRNMEKRLRALN